MKKIIKKALSLSPNEISYYVSQSLFSKFPNKEFIEGHDCAFNVTAFAKANPCIVKSARYCYNQSQTTWYRSYGLYETPVNGYFEVTWQENKLNLLLMTWQQGSHPVQYYWILANTKEVANDFLSAVCKSNTKVKGENLVYENGDWRKDKELFESIKSSNFDNLILSGTLKEDIEDEISSFFASRKIYEDYGVSWKRGILFIGSPGNGKTHTVKAIVNQAQKPCLYVKSFKSYCRTSSSNISRVFEQARQMAPCIIVLEDLDSLIDDSNRSSFLNVVDGFGSNQGVLILATTNHPERIDPALRDRAGRFDSKYEFKLPGIIERASYIEQWNNSVKKSPKRSPMGLSDAGIDQIAELTDQLSFASLQEMILSSTTQWVKTAASGNMIEIMSDQVTKIKDQTNSTATFVHQKIHEAKVADWGALMELARTYNS
ncbi:ATPase [Pleurocapsa sp. CCALA 161]|uniref:ATP-binding protein n=1 Tax=Pleurocapsa sp. CCALA 161 TaxID=2107688 RepID=UPI000D0786BD|nr:ATP-binding protein [Pleurocapsa sp. CCALA 161]PSB11214.1 ATPase [Pleurocapsa sp. CCALA 161]